MRAAFVALFLCGAAHGEPLQVAAVAALQGNPGLLGGALAARWGKDIVLLGDLAVGLKAGRVSLGVELKPWSFLSLGAGYRATLYPGVLGLAQSYASPHVEHESGFASSPPGDDEMLVVQEARFELGLTHRLGRVSLRNLARASRFFVDVRDGDRVFYDPGLDVAVYAQGWAIQDDTDVEVAIDARLSLGVRHTLVVAWYPEAAFAPGEATANPETPTSRLGPTLRWTFISGRRPITVAATAQWYLRHRYREGGVPLLGATLTVPLAW